MDMLTRVDWVLILAFALVLLVAVNGAAGLWRERRIRREEREAQDRKAELHRTIARLAEESRERNRTHYVPKR